MAWNVCIEIPEIPDPLELVLPGGMTIKHPNLDELIQPALAPLGPAFAIIDSIVTLCRVFTELKGALLTVPPDFKRAGVALEKAGAVPANLAKLMPTYAVPALLAGCIDAVSRTLKNSRSQLLQLADQVKSVVQVEATARQLGDTKLLAVFECAQHNVQQEAANIGKGMASIGHILGTIELLSKLAGHSLAVPNLQAIDGKSLNETIAPLDTLIAAMDTLRKALPVPK